MPTKLCWWLHCDTVRVKDIQFIQTQAKNLNTLEYPSVNDMRRLINIFEEWMDIGATGAVGYNNVEKVPFYDNFGKFFLIISM
jgi:hypothetical protein